MKIRKCLDSVLPYVPGKSEEEIKKEFNIKNVIKIASNENPYGPTPKICNLYDNINYNIYPDNYDTKLREKLSAKLGVNKSNLLFGNGSVEIIQMLARVFLDPNDNVISELPSFSSYFSEAMIQNAQIKTIKYNSDFSFDINSIIELIDEKTKIIFLTNPNNPLGTILSKEELNMVMEKVPKDILVVVDEAYYEFVRDENYVSAIDYIKDYDNICVLRTFSKAYGLASLRIGYIVANENVISNLEKVRVPFNVSTIAQKAAIIALEDQEYMNQSIKKIHKTIDYMYESLDKLNIQYIKTQANFIMINVRKSAEDVTYELLKRGYIVRAGFPLMDNWIRVSISTLEDMQGFIKALCEVIK